MPDASCLVAQGRSISPPPGFDSLTVARFDTEVVIHSDEQLLFAAKIIPSPQILPALLIDRNMRPVVICADWVQAFSAVFTHKGIGTVRM